KTIVPSQAHAKVSCRLVTDQDPDEIFDGLRSLAKSAAPDWAEVLVTRISDSRPARVDPTTPLARSALQALRTAFGQEPSLSREGGSVPVVGMLGQRVRAPLAHLSFSPPDDNAHAPN